MISITHQCSVLEADINETKRPFSFKLAVKRRTYVLGISNFILFSSIPSAQRRGFNCLFHFHFTTSLFISLSCPFISLSLPFVFLFASLFASPFKSLSRPFCSHFILLSPSFHWPFNLPSFVLFFSDSSYVQLLILVRVWKNGFMPFAQYVSFFPFCSLTNRPLPLFVF